MAEPYDFSQIEAKYGLPSGYLARTREIESGNGRDTYNKNSGAAGDFQFIPSTAKQYGLTDPYDTMAAADAAARLAADNMAALRRGGLENPTAAHLYLAHQQGAGGALKLLQGEGAAGDLVGARAVSLNGGDPRGTGAQFATHIMDYYGPGTAGPQAPRVLTPQIASAAPGQAQSLPAFPWSPPGQAAPQATPGAGNPMAAFPWSPQAQPAAKPAEEELPPPLPLPPPRRIDPQLIQLMLASGNRGSNFRG